MGGPGITEQHVVTSSRTAGTVYQNTNPGAMFVLTTWTLDLKDATVIAYTDGTNPPTTAVAAAQDPSQAGSVTLSIAFIVLAGYYYRCVVSGGTPTLVGWVEYI